MTEDNLAFTHLPARMAQNSVNLLTYTSTQGSLVRKPYAHVLHEVGQVMHQLKVAGFSLQGKRIIVCGKPNYDWVRFALAIIFSGGEMVALPETMSDKEIEESTDGMRINHAFVGEELVNNPGLGEIQTHSFDLILQKIMPDSPSLSLSDCNPAEKMVAYTSGSTASSKLKAFHVPLCTSTAFTDRFREIFKLNEQDNWLICHSFSHIVHFEYLLGGLYWGYNVTLATVFQLLMKGATYEPAVIVTVPSVYEQLAAIIKRRVLEAPNGNERLIDIQNTPIFDPDGNVLLQPLTEAARLVLGGRLKMMLIGAAPSSRDLQSFLLQVGLPLFEGYGMSEVNMISCHRPNQAILSTAGKAWPGMEIKLNDDGCLLVRTSPQRATEYLNCDSYTNEKSFLVDGWINTGDLAEIEDGVIKIVGRKKDTIMNSGGKNINPGPIEAKLQSIEGVHHAVIVGDKRPFLSAIVTSLQGEFDHKQRVAVKNKLATINESLPIYKRVLEVIFSSTPFTEEQGTLTRSGKPRKDNIIEYFQSEVKEIYED